MRVVLLRILLGALAAASIVVFVVQLHSPRNDATTIAELCVLVFAVMGVLGWRAGGRRS